MTKLIEYQRDDEERHRTNDVRQKLRPLVEGRPVALSVKDPKQATTSRIGIPILFVMPGSLVGDPSSLVFSLKGGRCEVVRVDDLKTTPLVRCGLRAPVAKMLVQELKALYDEEGPQVVDEANQ